MSVFANGREVSGKATPNKIIAAFPSVCLSPPSPPAGPIPIPYPLFTDSGKTGDGTGSVKIKKKEVGKKNGSTYTKSQGNEPATRSFGMDVVSHTISGKNKHQAYSFDVLFEKAGAERFLDFTTTNHGSDPATAFTIDVAKPNVAVGPPDAECVRLRAQVNSKRDQLSDATKNKRATKGTISAFETDNNTGSGVFASNALMRDKLDLPEPELKPHVKGKGRPSEVCGGKAGHHHPSRGSANHTEAQAFDALKPGSSIVMAIDYPALEPNKAGVLKRNEKKSNWPCRSCRRLMKAACECEIKIEICVNGQKQDYCALAKSPA